MKKIKVINLASFLSRDLILRDSADKLFDAIADAPEKYVKIDFKDVSSMTMSFAHQYALRKEASKKEVSEVNVLPHLKKMFGIVNVPVIRPAPMNLSIHPISI